MTMNLSVESTKDFFSTFSKNNGNIKITYDNIKEPLATKEGNNYQLTLPQPSIHTEDKWYGQSHKELSYLLPANRFLFDAQRDYKPGSPEHLAASIIADNIAERRDYGEYKGRSRHLANNRRRISEQLHSKMSAADPSQLTPESEMLRSLVNYDIRTRKNWMSISSAPELENCQYMGNLRRMFGPEGFPLVTNADEFKALVQKVIKILEEEPPEPEDGDGEEPDSDNGSDDNSSDNGSDDNNNNSGENQDAANNPDESQDQSTEGQADSAESSGSEDQGQESQDQKSQGSDDQEGVNDNLEFSKGSGSDNISSVGTGGGVDQEKSNEICKLTQENFKDVTTTNSLHEARQEFSQDPGEYVPCLERRVVTSQDLDKAFRQDQYDSTANLYVKNPQIIMDLASEYPISKKLRKYLQVLMNTAYQRGLKKGKLNHNRLSRVALEEREPKVFKKKLSSRLNMDTAIQVLTDCSGSMSGRKEKVASVINVCIHDVLKSVGSVPYELLGFSDFNVLNHMIFKDFESPVARYTLAQRLCSPAKTSGGNSDGDSLMWAVERLLHRPEANKICIVLSDGQPAGSYVGNGSTYLKNVCRRIEQQSSIKLWGIGILTTAPARYYKNHYICQELEELGGIVLNILKKSLTLTQGRTK